MIYLLEKWCTVWVIIIMTLVALVSYGFADSEISAWILFFSIIILFVGSQVILGNEERKRKNEAMRIWRANKEQAEITRRSLERIRRENAEKRKR